MDKVGSVFLPSLAERLVQKATRKDEARIRNLEMSGDESEGDASQERVSSHSSAKSFAQR